MMAKFTQCRASLSKSHITVFLIAAAELAFVVAVAVTLLLFAHRTINIIQVCRVCTVFDQRWHGDNGITGENRKSKCNQLHCLVIQKQQNNNISYAYSMRSPIVAPSLPPASHHYSFGVLCQLLSLSIADSVAFLRYHSPYKSHTIYIWHCHSANVLRIIQFVAPSARMCLTSIQQLE